MADPPVEINVDVEVPLQNQQQNRNGNGRAQAQNNTFGVVRDRLFHAMLVKVALSYSSHVGTFWRRVIEFVSLLIAVCLLFTLLFVHLMFTRSTTTCLDHIRDSWPRDGVIRLEVVHNLHMLEYKESWIKWYNSGLLSYFIRAPWQLLLGNSEATAPDESYEENNEHERYTGVFFEQNGNAEVEFNEHFRQRFQPEDAFRYEYRVEYSLLYGILRLPVSFRSKHNITTLWTRVDADSECFGDAFSRRVMRAVLGYDDVVMASLRALAHNLSEDGIWIIPSFGPFLFYVALSFYYFSFIRVRGVFLALICCPLKYFICSLDSAGLGYLHDLSTNEHYHFVSFIMSKSSYITAAIVMLIFTFAISMLLRFSHHQIFLFIVDLLHMFELNQPLVFPAAPLFTVILALVGMETIMSEVFADTTTAFYVILIVWIADQYDAICCHSHHSMVFFFHHYEMPLILYQDRLQRILTEIDTAPIGVSHNQTEEISTSLTEVGLVRAEASAVESPAAIPSVNAVERVAEEVVSEAIDELFL
uniref:Membralin n=1 Tax=Angiostrongylus cantonensis TaxID=6313 RepID=A0A158PB63_ANGCA